MNCKLISAHTALFIHESSQWAAGKNTSVLFSQPGESPVLFQPEGSDNTIFLGGTFLPTKEERGLEFFFHHQE